MPHIIVKLWPGQSEQKKLRLVEAITENVTTILGYGNDAVSVSFEEVQPPDWRDQVYRPDIVQKAGNLYKKPGYSM
ncbi:4-oxalocrotonate tautomerase [Acetobacter nitrogenifigens DSM 23921 = NBRC 105050]|uniref:Tautomerase PptA n=1 Tax=Acetobacter nitrogenifigens DSM 23921 = NBRC 105050 TaxID=1120919 RepID=A0A511X891_9PROT|nr:tautomerase family protein [Acetobacter nitrogenifigens]GBQ89518.1 4-oxalocrotonate tautomerase [Acetobacter nitrogenifigens DSM 23921 = NBRC 105050]GEN59164.1 tautomerase PptA [Acetobacter nitrogenifigens DSM 23921 = NBRC 105050]